MNSTKSYEVNEDELTSENLNKNITLNSSSWKYEPPFGSIGIGLHASFIIPMALFGLFANIVNIVVINRLPKSKKSVFMHFIVSLSVSDIGSSFISVLLLYRNTWGYVVFSLPTIFCKVGVAGDLMTSIVTSFHILLFCILRLTAVAKPHTFGRIKLVHAKISIVVIWIFAFLVGVFTYGWWVNVEDIDRHNDKLRRTWPSCSTPYKWLPYFARFGIYGNAILFYFPFIGIAGLSIAIGLVLFGRRNQRIKNDKNKTNSSNQVEMDRQKKENQAVRQLVLIVFAYFFGYIPLTVVLIIIPRLPTHETRIQWIFLAISYTLLRISETLNPIFYNLGSSLLWEETVKFLRQIFRIKRNEAANNQRSKARARPATNTRVTEI